ncbi:MAG: FAD-dependent monooxygenase [Angustibacter sp.]
MKTTHSADEFPSETPILIVGAGPSGLMLAAELALAGQVPLLIDELPSPTGQSRALGFTVRTLELFRQRGILERFAPIGEQPDVHFAGLRIAGEHLSSSMRPANQYPQSRTEEALSSWLLDLTVAIHRPWQLLSIEPGHRGFRCRLSGPTGPKDIIAQYVVGCDGSRSKVRQESGFTSVRTEPSVQMLLADFRGSSLADEPFGVKHKGGMVMSAPLGDGTERLIVCDFSQPFKEQGALVTPEDVRAAYLNVVGEPLVDGECLWASSFTDASSLVDTLHRDGILLVGDSAHTHLPAGGQGMNVAIADAVNLGWKLAAVSLGEAPASLLDSYHAERYPVAQRLLRNTAAQGQLFLRGTEVNPLREILADLLEIPAVSARLADSVSGLDIHYDFGVPDGHRLIGGRLPPESLLDPRARTDGLAELQFGTSVLFCLANNEQLLLVAKSWASRLRVASVVVQDEPFGREVADADAILVRPDGHIAWIGKDPDGLRDSLTRWCGLPPSLSEA